MSASPAGPPGMASNGAPSKPAPNGAPPRPRRRPPPPTNPLVSAQKRGARRMPPRPNGNGPARPAAPSAPPKPTAPTYSSYGPPPGARVEEIPIVTTKKSLLQGLRHHAMRFHSRTPVNPTDQSDFTRPIRLHRRDPGLGKSGAGAQEEEEDEEDEKERAKQEALREERRRNRDEIQAQIAPKGKGRVNNSNAKKTQQVYDRQDTEESRKAAQLRYEETLPWHLEDFDNKNTWVGSYEAALSETHVMFLFENAQNNAGSMSSRLRMVPIEKWYKFTAKDKQRLAKSEDVDMEKRNKIKKEPHLPEWIKARERQKEMEKEKEQMILKAKGIRARVGHDADEDGPKARADGTKREVDADIDVIDYDVEEDFADDEEGVNGLFEGDEEDTKAVQNKLRKEQLEAKHVSLQNENAAWEQEEEEKIKAEEEKRLEREVRKALTKREKNFNYIDDDESDMSSSDDSKVEREKEEERKKEEEARAAEREQLKEQSNKKAAEKTASGASSKGNTTPSGRPKTTDPLKTSLSTKRPASPNHSEQSGNESSRKKHKKEDRPQDPALRRLGAGAGSGSDSEAATDAGKKRGLPIGTPRNGNTPVGSRAGSPTVGASRAGSPAIAGNGQARPRPPQPTGPIPTIEEIRAVIPAEGIGMAALISRFKARVGSAPDKTRVFTANVKAAGRFDKETKKLFPVGGK